VDPERGGTYAQSKHMNIEMESKLPTWHIRENNERLLRRACGNGVGSAYVDIHTRQEENAMGLTKLVGGGAVVNETRQVNKYLLSMSGGGIYLIRRRTVALGW